MSGNFFPEVLSKGMNIIRSKDLGSPALLRDIRNCAYWIAEGRNGDGSIWYWVGPKFDKGIISERAYVNPSLWKCMANLIKGVRFDFPNLMKEAANIRLLIESWRDFKDLESLITKGHYYH